MMIYIQLDGPYSHLGAATQPKKKSWIPKACRKKRIRTHAEIRKNSSATTQNVKTKRKPVTKHAEKKEKKISASHKVWVMKLPPSFYYCSSVHVRRATLLKLTPILRPSGRVRIKGRLGGLSVDGTEISQRWMTRSGICSSTTPRVPVLQVELPVPVAW